ncbi:MAG TPA: hypothetical protein VMR39_27305, partial [Sphingobium sp.]|nr:hypothetical protein [Sphingobium sp.]
GDLMDLTALGFAARRANGRPALWGAVAFVAGAAALDALVARALDRQAGKASPLVMGPASPVSVRAGRHATTIEPDSKRLVRAPDVPSQTP